MNIFDRLSQGPGAAQSGDYDNWNEMVGSAPPDRFGRAAYDAVRQVDPDEYYRHTQPGIGGTDPFGALTGDQRGGLIGTLLQNLLGRGIGQDQIMQGSGLGSLDPRRMSPSDMASLAQWAQRNHPQAFGYTASQYQNDPGILGSLLGNKALMTMAGALGAKILADQLSRRR
jgi:hypothetical protein